MFRSKIRSRCVTLCAFALGFAVAATAAADRTILVGGTIIEGKATRTGDKVVVQVEAGEITLPAESVLRIEKSESVVSQFETKYKTLPKHDAPSRLALADYCRDHGMRAEEHRLLLEVLDIDRDNAAARARLGFVKSDAGWITQADALRARGLVQYEGQWMSPTDVARIEHQRLEREADAERRESEEQELQAKRLQLSAEQTAMDAEAARIQTPAFGYGGYYGYAPYYGPLYSSYRRPGFGVASPGLQPRHAAPTRHFEDTSLSVVKVPYRRH